MRRLRVGDVGWRAAAPLRRWTGVLGVELPEGPSPGPGPVLPADVVRAAHAGGWLTTTWLPVLLALLTVLAVAVLVVRRVRRHVPVPGSRRARVLRGTASGLVVLLLCTLTAGAVVNRYAGYFPTLASAARFARGDETGTGSQDAVVPGLPHGDVVVDPASLAAPHPSSAAALTVPAGRGAAAGWRVQSLHFDDAALDVHQRTVVLAVPPGYAAGAAAGRRYPVVYLLSGYPGRPSDWLVAGHAREVVDALVAHHLLPPVVLVAPDVNGGFTTDSETLDAAGGPQVQTWLTRDVVGWVDEHLATTPDRAHRVLVGMSSGGYAALNVALRHTDEFGLIGAMEPYGDPGNVTARLLGGSVAELHAQSPSWYLPTEAFTRRLVAFVDIGDGARREDRERVQGLADLVAARGQTVQLRVEHGEGHTWTEALQGLPYALALAGQHLGDPALLATYPAADFPPAHGSARLRELSPDAGAARQQHQAGVARPPAGQVGTGITVGRARHPAYGPAVPTACPRPRACQPPAASPSPSGSARPRVVRS